MIKLTLYSTLIILTDWLMKCHIFARLSNIKPSPRQLLIFLGLLPICYAFNPRLGLLLEPIYLLLWVLFLLKPAWKLPQLLYYSLMPFVSVELFYRVTGGYQAKYLLLVETPNFREGFWFTLLSLSLVLVFFYLFIKVMAVDFAVLNQMYHHARFKKVLFILIAGLLTYAMLLHPVLALSGREQSAVLEMGGGNFEASVDLLLSYGLLFIGGLLYLNHQSKTLLFQQLQEAKDNQLSALSAYSQHVEALYGELRSFRHDYTNILVSLNLAIQEGDLEQVAQIYQAVMAQSDKPFYDSKYDIAKLSNLQDPALKSLISAKLMAAQSQGIAISVEIPEPLGLPRVDVLELIQLLSIFLDNAIEATNQASQPSLSIAYFQEGQEKILVIENTTLEEKINTRRLFEQGYSTKGKGRGIGLANVRAILAKHPHANLDTQSYKHRFSQVLRVGE